MRIKNPNYSIQNKENIFNIREKEYNNLMVNIREILRPAEDAGLILSEFDIKESPSSEVEKTLKKNIIIKFKRNTQEIDLSVYIPKLIDGNYFSIAGKRKIPLFQLYDIPIVTRGKNIKFRSNLSTILIISGKKHPYIKLSFMGKEIPFALVYFASFDSDYIVNKFNLNEYVINDNPQTDYEKLLFDLYAYYVDNIDYQEYLGEYFTKYDKKKTGEIIAYALSLIPKIDIITSKFMRFDNVLDELTDILKNNKSIDDLDYTNKRIRCFEYVVLSTIMKNVYDLCISSRKSKIKFNINSKKILANCNLSDIVQFDFSINPIDELTKLSRITLVGPGGFNKANVPHYLRDLSDSMFGRICPVDTSDRDNCGVLQCLLPSSKYDENMRFNEEICEKNPTSVAISMIPFLEHDDQTRLQMSASQMRQAINLSEFDVPLIQSGCENLYTDKTQFIKRAKKDGEVIYLDSKFVIIAYKDNDYDIFDIDNRHIYVKNMDIMHVYVKLGDKVSEGDIIAESNFCKNGSINIGKNLLTAIMPFYGYNYEDAIVISDRLLNDDSFTSIHYANLSFVLPPDKLLLSLDENRYKPLPEPNPDIEFSEPGKDKAYYRKHKRELILKGNPYAIMKDIPNDPMNYLSIFEENIPLIYNKDVLITNVEIYPNEYNNIIPQFRHWVDKKFESQISYNKKIQELIFKLFSKKKAIEVIREKGLDRFNNRGRFKFKGERINGIYIKIGGFFSRKIQIGDKIGNRHGNKGVISKILPHDLMPKTEDGKHVDIIINPLSTYSRMNVGQIFELHMGMSVNDFKIKLNEMLNNKELSQDELKGYILDYIKILDNTKDNWYTLQVKEELNNSIIDEKFIENFYIIAPPFESSTCDQIKKACEFTNTEFRYDIFDEISKQKIISKVALGYMYFFRMVHIAEERLAARGIGPYMRKTMQPPSGRKNKGGQRSGEMETFCFISHAGLTNLTEMTTTKSDSIDLKNKYIRDSIGSEFIREIKDECQTPESVKLLEAYLKTIGISID
jgi:DNA-directed RNA polymerase beta subunit